MEGILWVMFGVGGSWCALFLPALLLVMGVIIPDGGISRRVLTHEAFVELSRSWIVRLGLTAAMGLPLCCAAHRMHYLFLDFQVPFKKIRGVLYAIGLSGIAFSLYRLCMISSLP